MKNTSKTSKRQEGMHAPRSKLHKRAKKAAAPAAAPRHCQLCGALLQDAIDQYRSADGRKVLCMQHFLQQFARDFAEDLRKKLAAQLEAFETAELELQSAVTDYAAAAALCAENETLLLQLREQSRTDESKLEDAADMQLQVQRNRWVVSETKTRVTAAKASMTRAVNKSADYAESALVLRAQEEAKLKAYRATVPNYKVP